MGRANHIDGLFVKIDVREIDADAFKRLKPLAWKARTAIAAEYWRSGGVNPMPISCLRLGQWIGCGSSAAQEALHELVEHGYLTIEKEGSLRGAKGGRAQCYRLTWEKTQSGRSPSFDFRRLQKAENSTSSLPDRTSGTADRTCAMPDVALSESNLPEPKNVQSFHRLAADLDFPRGPAEAGRNPLSDKLSSTLERSTLGGNAPSPRRPILTTTARSA